MEFDGTLYIIWNKSMSPDLVNDPWHIYCIYKNIDKANHTVERLRKQNEKYAPKDRESVTAYIEVRKIADWEE